MNCTTPTPGAVGGEPGGEGGEAAAATEGGVFTAGAFGDCGGVMCIDDVAALTGGCNDAETVNDRANGA